MVQKSLVRRRPGPTALLASRDVSFQRLGGSDSGEDKEKIT
jgi:hypothetical protein